MTTLQKTAGAAGSISFTTKNTAGQLITPVSTPVAQWYTDSGRTLGATALTVTGAGSSWAATWTAGQAPSVPASRFLKFTIEVSAGVFDVDADDDLAFVDASVSLTNELVSLLEVKTHIGQGATATPALNTRDNDELQFLIYCATPIIERLAGPVFPRTITETHRRVSGAVALREAPVLSVTSVNAEGTVLPAYSDASRSGYDLDPDSGVLDLSTIGHGGRVVVTYTAGRGSVPYPVQLAARELVAWWWRGRKGGNPTFDTPGGQATPMPVTGVMEKRLLELLGPEARTLGFA